MQKCFKVLTFVSYTNGKYSQGRLSQIIYLLFVFCSLNLVNAIRFVKNLWLLQCYFKGFRFILKVFDVDWSVFVQPLVGLPRLRLPPQMEGWG